MKTPMSATANAIRISQTVRPLTDLSILTLRCVLEMTTVVVIPSKGKAPKAPEIREAGAMLADLVAAEISGGDERRILLGRLAQAAHKKAETMAYDKAIAQEVEELTKEGMAKSEALKVASEKVAQQQFNIVRFNPDEAGDRELMLTTFLPNHKLVGQFRQELRAASEEFRPLLKAALALAEGQASAEDIKLLMECAPTFNGESVSAATLASEMYPKATLSEILTLLRQGAEPANKEALNAKCLQLMQGEFAAMSLYYGRTNLNRFSGELDTAVQAFWSQTSAAFRTWIPWSKGTPRTMCEVVLPTAAGNAAMETTYVWSQASGTLRGTERRRFTIVKSTREELRNRGEDDSAKAVLQEILLSGELMADGQEFNLTEVEFWLQVINETHNASMDAEVGSDDENKTTLGMLLAGPSRLEENEDAVLRFENARLLAEDGEAITQMLEEWEDRRSREYLYSLSDNGIDDYLRIAGINNTVVRRGILMNIRKEQKAWETMTDELNEANGVSILRHQRHTTEELVAFCNALHMSDKRRVKVKPQMLVSNEGHVLFSDEEGNVFFYDHTNSRRAYTVLGEEVSIVGDKAYAGSEVVGTTKGITPSEYLRVTMLHSGVPTRVMTAVYRAMSDDAQIKRHLKVESTKAAFLFLEERSKSFGRNRLFSQRDLNECRQMLIAEGFGDLPNLVLDVAHTLENKAMATDARNHRAAAQKWMQQESKVKVDGKDTMSNNATLSAAEIEEIHELDTLLDLLG